MSAIHSLQKHISESYTHILHKELISASGCTEPASIALCSAKMRQLLGEEPEIIDVYCSAGVLKNVQSVGIPNSGNLVGVEPAAILGFLLGTTENELKIFTAIDDVIREKSKKIVQEKRCNIHLLSTTYPLHIRVEGRVGNITAVAEIQHKHTNFVYLEQYGNVLLDIRDSSQESTHVYQKWYDLLALDHIITFANEVDLEQSGLDTLLEKQITQNMAIASEGITHEYGSSVGKTLIETFGHSVENYARAYAAAASDARMNGCELPVVINSGSGNQGLTVTLPVVAYATTMQKDRKTLKRALVLSNLVAIYIKTYYGQLSPFCGVVSAAAGSGAAITYLHGGNEEHIQLTISNTLANISGIICDGAKASCAAKIATSVDAAILGDRMSRSMRSFRPGSGFVGESIEKTLKNVGLMIHDGMKGMDNTILSILIHS